MTTEVLTAIMLLAGLWSVLCRINQMQAGVTMPVVFWQHATLGMGLCAALLVPAPWAKMVLAVSIAAYLIAGASRWRYAAPRGTETQPGDLAPAEFVRDEAVR
jgi:hypothetical protein